MYVSPWMATWGNCSTNGWNLLIDIDGSSTQVTVLSQFKCNSLQITLFVLLLENHLDFTSPRPGNWDTVQWSTTSYFKDKTKQKSNWNSRIKDCIVLFYFCQESLLNCTLMNIVFVHILLNVSVIEVPEDEIPVLSNWQRCRTACYEMTLLASFFHGHFFYTHLQNV